MDSTPDSPSSAQSLTGRDYEISAAGYRATVCEQGATLRSLTREGTDLVLPSDPGTLPTGSRGQHLTPWPNRIRDGHYVFDGTDQQLPINEIDRNNAIHGLVRWMLFDVVEHTEESITQKVGVVAQPGWPGRVEITIMHRVGADGLTVEVGARNTGSTPIPFGYAPHPYLVAGPGVIDDWRVSAPFGTYLVTDDRLLPIQLASVARRPEDLRAGNRFGDRVLDTAYTGATETGRWQVEIRNGDATRVLWADPELGWAQVYTPGDRRSLAVEPMTCGPDAFNEGPTHDSMLRLAPGDEIHLRWGIHA
ncbi:aldose 1-epimerase family protein [Acidipropionibacterium virtanenii]|uniref:Aldose 1-epimerase n=1 Tax=Acidipropionibacterium virtanenii TaxID=2057246 RepID=A0A344UUL7_9ACTN|nr:aldose 1-epimerase family protein [Acidipropionibacterium virtanenii]AXE38965.1 Aldose 1-epimerase [Acidipropionibacterium virtanenii]